MNIDIAIEIIAQQIMASCAANSIASLCEQLSRLIDEGDPIEAYVAKTLIDNLD